MFRISLLIVLALCSIAIVPSANACEQYNLRFVAPSTSYTAAAFDQPACAQPVYAQPAYSQPIILPSVSSYGYAQPAAFVGQANYGHRGGSAVVLNLGNNQHHGHHHGRTRNLRRH